MKKNKQKLTYLILSLVAIVLLFAFFQSQTYQPADLAQEALANNQPSVKIEQTNTYLALKPLEKSEKASLIFYQGAFVAAESYSLWAKLIAQAGYPVYLVHHPFNLAILQPDLAKQIIKAEQVKAYYLGGHSLGGVSASRFTKQAETTQLKGLFFLASYPAEKDSLTEFAGQVLSLTASEDLVLDQERYQKAKKLLPPQTIYQVIEGGNHAGFGDYGPQRKDGQAKLSVLEQQTLLADYLLAWLEEGGESHGLQK